MDTLVQEDVHFELSEERRLGIMWWIQRVREGSENKEFQDGGQINLLRNSGSFKGKQRKGGNL